MPGQRFVPRAGELLPVEGLRCFLLAAEHRHFRHAARAAGLSPQAFSQRIAALEALLDTVLFARTTRSVRLTPEGERLREPALRALEAVAACPAAVREPGTLPPTRLTVGTRHELGLSWLEPFTAALPAALAWLEAQLYFGAGPDLLEAVRARRVDCIVSSARFDDPVLDALPLHREDYAFVAAPRLLRRTPFTRTADAREHCLVDIDGSLPLFRYVRDEWGGEGSWTFQRVVGMGTIEAVRRRVVAGQGVAVLPTYFVGPDLNAKRLVPILPSKTPRHDFFRLVFRGDDPRRAAFEALAEGLRAYPLR